MRLVLLGAAAAMVAGTMLVQPVLAEDVTIKLWARADRSGPLRAGNIVAAADQMNRMFEAAGSDTRVTIDLIETNAAGFDADALDLLKAHSVGDTPDIAVAAHEWIGAFVEAGMVANLEDHISANAAMYADIIPQLWESVKFKGERYGIPQDSEVRMFFINKDIARAAGKTDSELDALDLLGERGRVHHVRLVRHGRRGRDQRCCQIWLGAPAQCRPGFPDGDGQLWDRELQQGRGQAADHPGGAGKILWLAEILRRQRFTCPPT